MLINNAWIITVVCRIILDNFKEIIIMLMGNRKMGNKKYNLNFPVKYKPIVKISRLPRTNISMANVIIMFSVIWIWGNK